MEKKYSYHWEFKTTSYSSSRVRNEIQTTYMVQKSTNFILPAVECTLLMAHSWVHLKALYSDEDLSPGAAHEQPLVYGVALRLLKGQPSVTVPREICRNCVSVQVFLHPLLPFFLDDFFFFLRVHSPIKYFYGNLLFRVPFLGILDQWHDCP